MSRTPTGQETQMALSKTFREGPDLVEKTTSWARGMVKSISKELKELETVSHEALPIQMQELRLATIDLVRQKLVPVLRDSVSTARVGALLSRQGQNVCQLKKEHREGFLRGTAHLVWDCHQRAEMTTGNLRDIRRDAANLLADNPVQAQGGGEGWNRGMNQAASSHNNTKLAPHSQLIASVRSTLGEIFSWEEETPFDKLVNWWQRTSLELHNILYNTGVIDSAFQVHLEVITKTWGLLERRYEEYKTQMEKAFDGTFGRDKGDHDQVAPMIDIEAELPEEFHVWARKQPGFSTIPTHIHFTATPESASPGGGTDGGKTRGGFLGLKFRRNGNGKSKRQEKKEKQRMGDDKPTTPREDESTPREGETTPKEGWRRWIPG